MELDALLLPTGKILDQLTTRSNTKGSGAAFTTRMTETEFEVWSELPQIEDQPDLGLSLSTTPQLLKEPLHIRDLAQPEFQILPRKGVKTVESELQISAHSADIVAEPEPGLRPSNPYVTPESSTQKAISKQVMPEFKNAAQEEGEPKHLVRSKAENIQGPVTETETSSQDARQPTIAQPERKLLVRRLPSTAPLPVGPIPSSEGEAVREIPRRTGEVQLAAKHKSVAGFQPLRNEISLSPVIAGEIFQPSETSHSTPLASSPVFASPQLSGHSVPSQMQAVHSLIVASPSHVVDIISQSLGSEEGPKERVMIQLDPPELGRVSLDFKFDAQGLQHVTITGETPEALRQLRMMHFELIQALEQRGLSGQDMTFRHQQDQQSSGTQAASELKEPQTEDQLVEKGEQITKPRHSNPGPVASNGLNITL